MRAIDERLGWFGPLWRAVGFVSLGLVLLRSWLRGPALAEHELLALLAIELGLLGYELYRRVFAITLIPRDEGFEVLRRGKLRGVFARESVRPWSRHKATSDVVRGSLFSLLVLSVGVIMYVADLPIAGALVAVTGGCGWVAAIHDRKRLWTLEAPAEKGVWMFTLARRDVVAVLGHWPGDPTPAAVSGRVPGAATTA